MAGLQREQARVNRERTYKPLQLLASDRWRANRGRTMAG